MKQHHTKYLVIENIVLFTIVANKYFESHVLSYKYCDGSTALDSIEKYYIYTVFITKYGWECLFLTPFNFGATFG